MNILKMAGLTELSFEIRIPQTKLPFASYSGGFKGAEYFLNKLERLKTGQSSFQFIVSRVLPNGKSLFDTNIKVSLEDYEIKEEADDGFDVVVGVKLKQYRSYGTKTVKISPRLPLPPNLLPKQRLTDPQTPEENHLHSGCGGLPLEHCQEVPWEWGEVHGNI